MNQIIALLKKEYVVFGSKKEEVTKTVLSEIDEVKSLNHDQTIMSFKKVIFSNNLDVKNIEKTNKKKLAFVGIANCDAWAIEYFLKQFEGRNILPPKENILIITAECWPNERCFCDLVGTNKPAPRDLHIQEDEKGEYVIFSGSAKGEALLKKAGVKDSKIKEEILPIKPNDCEPLGEKFHSIIEDKESFINFWKGIADNCFGCGACSVVCPLCFCTKHEFTNNLEGKSTECLQWDACFAKRFSEIQHHHDFRPQNVDRLYNWYHHKFARSYHENKFFLCTGCGRCIKACPANLNMKNILQTVKKLAERKMM